MSRREEALLVVALGLAMWVPAILAAGRIPRAWRGEQVRRVPFAVPPLGRVTHRGFPAFVLTALCFGSAIVLLGPATLTGGALQAVFVMALLALAAAGSLMVLAVEAFNRPSFAVPPSRRDEPGWVGQALERRRRKRRGRSPTDHPVCVLDVRPLPDEKDPYDPYFVAVCEDPDCEWISDVVRLDPQHPDPEAEVRRQAAEHSTRVAGPTDRPLG